MSIQFPCKERYTIDDLLLIMQILRSENGCPWDRAQTHDSIRMNFVEEVYEALEAIDRKDAVLLQEELGDVLLQVIFHARMEEEAGRFDFGDVVHDVCQKLVVRHPHIFGEKKAHDAKEALSNWNDIKRQTKGQKTYTETLTAVSKSLPGLMRAEKLHSRSKKAGLEPLPKEDLLSLIRAQTAAMEHASEQEMQHCIGKLLFHITALTQQYGFNGEELLERESDAYIQRFAHMEETVTAQEKQIKDCDQKWIHDLIIDEKIFDSSTIHCQHTGGKNNDEI